MPIMNHSNRLRQKFPRMFRAIRPLVLPLTLIFLMTLAGCGNENPNILQGYVEGEFVYVAAPIGGRLEYLAVKSGQTVAAGDPLFTLERSFEAAGVKEAEKNVRRAEDKLADLAKGLRPTEIAALKAKLAQARAGLDLAESEFKRREALFKDQTISKEELDKARTDFETARERVKEVRAELKTAGLGARTDEIKAARAEFEGAKARLSQAQWSFEQKAQAAPRPGLVFDLIYHKGEWVPAGRPV
ncbi:MAG: biotin/lipoyl-binding protein, partial [Thermodesulfobacteriota bacterium]|nr:biotin/lipoyl-binding protein [Thermodesulfobacteriota bacterium]